MTIPRNLSFLAQGASSTGVLSVPYGGTGLATLTAGYIPYGNGTGAFNSGSSLQYTSNGNGFSLAVASGGTWPEFSYQSSINLGNSGYGTFTARGGTTLFGSNFYVNSGAGYSYKNTDYASFLQFTNGQVQFITGPSGTAGTSISASQPMTVFPSGGVSIGNTTDPGATNLSVTGIALINSTNVDSNWKIQSNASSSGVTGIGVNNNGGYGCYLTYDNTGRYTVNGAAIRNIANTPIYFETNNTVRMMLSAAGGLSIGNTTDAGAGNLSVTGAITSASLATTAGLRTGGYLATGSFGYYINQGISGSVAYIQSLNNTTLNTLSLDCNNFQIRVAGFATGLQLDTTGNLSVAGTTKTAGYTVATLPTGVTGMRAYVTNALAPSYGATVVGGGAVTIPVFYNGTNWIVA